MYAIWYGLEMRKVPLVIPLVKQESHRAGVGNHEADGAAQAVDKEQEPEWCNRCIVVDLSCNCEACSLDAPGVAMPDSAPDISEPT